MGLLYFVVKRLKLEAHCTKFPFQTRKLNPNSTDMILSATKSLKVKSNLALQTPISNAKLIIYGLKVYQRVA